MSQSPFVSALEVTTSQAIGFVIGVLANWLVLPLFGYGISFEQSVAVVTIFTVISILRGYVVRRFFEVYFRRFLAWCESIYSSYAVMKDLT